MTAVDPPLVDTNAVDRLAADLAAAGYDAEHVPALLGPDAHHDLGRGDRWSARHVTARAAANGSILATLTRLLLLGTSEPADRVAAALPSLGLDGALACGVIEYDAARDDGTVRAALDIRPHADDQRSYLVVSDLDSDARPGPLRSDHVLGIGSASMTLARAVIRRPVGRVLDIGTGCGIQALHCHGHAESITATDTNPRALALAAATARLSEQEWDLRAGSLFEPVADEQFDLIVANPPFVISPGDQRFIYRDSGRAGDALCGELVSGLADHLTPGGTAHVLANWAIVGDGDWRLRVGEWVAATDCDGWVVQRDVATPGQYVSLWLADTGEAAGVEAEQRAGQWLDYFAAENISGVGMGLITLRKPIAPRDDTPDVVFDMATGGDERMTGEEIDAFLARRSYLATRDDQALMADTFSLAEEDMLDTRLVPTVNGWRTVLRILSRPGGPGAGVQLDEWGQALLAGCTGTVPLATQVELLARAHDVDPVALRDTVIPLIRTAVTRGVLRPVTGS